MSIPTPLNILHLKHMHKYGPLPRVIYNVQSCNRNYASTLNRNDFLCFLRAGMGADYGFCCIFVGCLNFGSNDT